LTDDAGDVTGDGSMCKRIPHAAPIVTATLGCAETKALTLGVKNDTSNPIQVRCVAHQLFRCEIILCFSLPQIATS
jgi:hypothetical protein